MLELDIGMYITYWFGTLTKGIIMPVTCRRSKAAVASSKSWERASKLCQAAGLSNKTLARSFIASNKDDDIVSILDGRIDKRNAKVRSIIHDYITWLKKR